MHAGLIPLEHQQAVQQAFQQCAPLFSTSPDTLSALVDKSLPTMVGLGGDSPNTFSVPAHIDAMWEVQDGKQWKRVV